MLETAGAVTLVNTSSPPTALADRRLFQLLLLAAAVPRLWYYLGNPSFWYDEARTGAYLYNDIPWSTAITWPIGLLWSQRLITMVFGHLELVLRLTPLLASLATLPLVYDTVATWFSRRTALITLALMVVSPPLVRFSVEYKQYSTDVLLTSLCALLFTRAIKQFPPTRSTVVLLWLVSSIGIWFSYVLMFPLAVGAAAYVFVHRLAFNRWRVHVLGSTLAAAISFVAVYWLYMRGLTNTRSLRFFWRLYFPPPEFAAAVKWGFVAIRDIFAVVLGFTPWFVGVAALACWLLGQYRLLAQRKWAEIIFFNGVIVLLLVAAASRNYPFGERPILFSAPFFLAVIAYGITTVEKFASRLALVLVAVMMGAQLVATGHQYADIASYQPFRPLLEQMGQHYKAEDIRLNGYARFAWYYYAHRFRFDGNVKIESYRSADFVRTIETTRRPTWFLWSQFKSDAETVGLASSLFLDAMRANGRIEHDFHVDQDPRTRVVLFIPARLE